MYTKHFRATLYTLGLIVFLILLLTYSLQNKHEYKKYTWDDFEIEIPTQQWEEVYFAPVENIQFSTHESRIGGLTLKSRSSNLKIHITITNIEIPPSNANSIGWLNIPGFDEKLILLDATEEILTWGLPNEVELLCIDSLGTVECKFLSPNLDSIYYEGFDASNKLFDYYFSLGNFPRSTISLSFPASEFLNQSELKVGLDTIRQVIW